MASSSQAESLYKPPRTLPEGTTIVCPECHRDLFRLNQVLVAGEILRTSMFDPIPPTPRANPGDRMKCPHCKGVYGKLTLMSDGLNKRCVIHTAEGWQ